MEKRALGRSGIMVPPLCFGGNVFGWTADAATSYALLDALVEAGFNFIDTADVYSVWVPGHAGGESESIIGDWLALRGGRDRVIIATKVGGQLSAEKKGLKRARIIEAVEESLRRLKTDYIDLYQSHFDDPDTPVEEPLEAYEQLIRAGKVRAIGASNFAPERLRAALDASRRGLPRYETFQPEYNLYARDSFEGPLQQICLEEEVGVIPYFALAAGFLTGKYRSEADLGKSPRGARSIPKYLNPRGLRILAALDTVAARHDATPARIALAWLMTRPAVTAPIASATSLAQLQELFAAAEVKLTDLDLQELETASAPA
ncbi:aldo/keto reductase [Camelimonas abortus]|uniref:Aldo/keto reductase n=1 Tax=Camelimonas abortus TaxID=1017184 RepID=A0ABV7LDR7_9HYPH